MFKQLFMRLLVIFTFCWAVRSVYRGIHESNIMLLVKGGFILFIYVAVGLILIILPDRQPPNPKQS